MKRVMGLLLVGCIMFSLVACGGHSIVNQDINSSDFVSENDLLTDDEDISGEPVGEEFIDPSYRDADGDGIITGRELGLMYYDYGSMEPDRQAYRLSCITDGINLATSGWTRDSYLEIYNDVMRNIYSYDGKNCAILGEIIFVERTGMNTTLLIKNNLLVSNPNIIRAEAFTDIPVVKGDTITVFGIITGLATYTNTNEYGTVTECETFNVSIEDYFIGRDTDVASDTYYVDGLPILTDEEKAYWYKTYRCGITLTENSIVKKGVEVPYTIYGYSYDQERGGYCLYIRYDEYEEAYQSDGYTLLYLTYEYPSFKTASSAIQFDGINQYYVCLNSKSDEWYVADAS